MNNESTFGRIVLAVLGAFNAVITIMTPLAVAILWGEFFDFTEVLKNLILIAGGLATLFRAYQIGWLNG